MVQDYAKIMPEPVLEKRAIEAPPAWSFLFTGLITGLAIGVFACFLLYLSGYVPPLQPTNEPRIVESPPPVAAPADQIANTEPTESTLQLDFYQELPAYEVKVDATPVNIESTPSIPLANGINYMLQSGVYEQRANADTQRARLQALGLEAVIKQQDMSPGQSRFLVQAGPFLSLDQLGNAESLLRSNNIDSMRVTLR